MAKHTGTASRRNRARIWVEWPAECRVGDLVLVGTILDGSAGGLFFRPEVNMTRQELVSDAEATTVVGAEEHVRIDLIHRSAPDVTLSGEIRWRGFSPQHDCSGFGVAVLESRADERAA